MAVHPVRAKLRAMTIRIILALLAVTAPSALFAQAAPPVAPAPTPVDDLVPVALDTAMGRIVIALDRGRAPKSVANFLAYVDGKKFDGEVFYRAMPYGSGGLIQGGITSNAAKLAHRSPMNRPPPPGSSISRGRSRWPRRRPERRSPTFSS